MLTGVGSRSVTGVENNRSVGNQPDAPPHRISGEGSVSRECVKDVFLEQGMIAKVEYSLDDNDIEFLHPK